MAETTPTPIAPVAPTTVTNAAINVKGDVNRTEKTTTYNPRERTFISKP